MHSRRIVIILMALGGLSPLLPLGGCGDDSKTSGTQVQMSPAAKADIDDMKAVMKERRAEKKAAAAAKRKR